MADKETTKEGDTVAHAKDEALALIERLPDEVTTDDIMEALYFKQKVEAGLKDVEEGRTISHAELKERIGEWRKSAGR